MISWLHVFMVYVAMFGVSGLVCAVIAYYYEKM